MQVVLGTELVPVIQASISPAILMSGIGLLLMSMTNRLGRIIDRARRLAELRRAGEGRAEAQIRIIWRRARLLRVSISLAAFGVLCAALVIKLLFLSSVFRVRLDAAVILLFVLGMFSVVVSLGIYIVEINQSLKAIGLELER